MSQSAVPNGDISTGSWTPTPVYPQIRQLLPGDPNFVSSDESLSSDTFKVSLSGVAWPASGPQILKVRLQNTIASDAIATITLLQGTTVIGTWVVQPGLGFTTNSLQLASTQIAAITNYADLQVQVNVSTIDVCGCTGLPFTLYAYISNVSGCACLANPGRYALTYLGGGAWLGNTVDLCNAGGGTYLMLQCVSGTWQLVIYCMGADAANAASANCSPLQLQFNGMTLHHLCCPGGTVDVLVLSS